MYVLSNKVGVGLSTMKVKSHVPSSVDALSKIGIKHASLSYKFLADFAKSNQFIEECVQNLMNTSFMCALVQSRSHTFGLTSR